MAPSAGRELDSFQFRSLHPLVFLGTASDRYAGWLGQIYTRERYQGRIKRRRTVVAGQSLVQEVLPLDSVAEYFEHFRTLELDFTFYRLLLEEDGTPTANYGLLQTYSKYLGEDDTLILKVPQVIFAQKLWRGGSFVDNELYLNPEVFTRQFFEPAVEILGSHVQSFIFEQEYQRKKDRLDVHTLSEQLDKFFRRIPADDRYHIELRTESYLASPVFRLLEKYGIGQVFSHWTWLPPLRAQFARAGRKFTSAAAQCIVRLMTPRGIRYDEAYARAHPFNRLVEEMLDQRMIDDTVALMVTAIKKGVRINVIINNRAGGNAPLIARQLAARFMEKVAGNRHG
ncbi:MAG: DUF72 domain-containing protein [Deltaproteobacteria bacterium]|nr:DUF72 domain-containing protein [Deltaproteobacteria bacterium]